MSNIMTNFRGDNDPNWVPFVDYISPPDYLNFLKKIPFLGHYIYSLFYALRMYRKRRKYNLAILPCNTAGMCFAFLQYFFFFNKVPIFYIENLWEKHNNKIIYYFKWIQLYFVDKVSIGFAVYSSCDALSYSNTFPIKLDKFVFVPFYPTLWKYSYTITDNQFIFSGGNGQRDYKQLIEVAKILPYDFFIACSDPTLLEGVDIPQNVRVESVSHQRFRELMACATIHVVALADGFLRSGGHQTYLNAMAMGKPVIVTDTKGAADYIDDGIDGFLLEPWDISKLSRTIDKLMTSPELRSFLSANAKEKVKQFTGGQYLEKLRLVAMEKLNNSNY